MQPSKAGESGRGFSVVAGEVRKLADQSSEAVEEIAEIITSMEQLSNSVTKEYSDILFKMQTPYDIANESHQSIQSLTGHVNSVNEMLIHIQEKMYSLHNLVPKMENSAEHNASLSQESQTYIEMMLHQTEDHYQEMKKYHQIGIKLNELAQQLNKDIQKFHL